MPVELRNEDPNDQFPVGMRVLAVDDDPICLRLLETLLRKCQYHVTTTSQAVMALKLLRENKDTFDLVISDVQMPDMDGFKLLELVGLEMDLPVIMLSAHADTKLVMKGITHGACDYLLKPVRIEELKNIWQHVVRRKKLDSIDRNNSNNQENRSCVAAEGHKSMGMNTYEPDGKIGKKRKDQNEEEDEEHDENEHDNEDPSNQKKPRVVWSVELHRKFVAAVNQLGLDKAVPKKILELMNVEKLTRENVASHLQKYRLYLRRISTVANQQANLVAALGSTDSTFLQMGSANFHNFNSPLQFQNSGVLRRLNSPTALRVFHGISPSNMVPLGHAQIPMNSINGCSKFQQSILPSDQTENILQGMPTSLEFDQLQHKKGVATGFGEFSLTNDNSMIFSISGVNNIVGGSSNSSISLQKAPSQGAFGNQPSLAAVVPLYSESSTTLSNHDRNNGNWPSAVQPSGVQSTSCPTKDFYQPAIPQSVNLRDTVSTALCRTNELRDKSSNIPVPSQSQDSRLDTQCQASLLSNNVVQSMNFSARQVWGDHKLNVLHHMDFVDSSVNSSVAPQGTCLPQKGATFNGNMDCGLIGQPSIDFLAGQHNIVENSVVQTAVKLKQYPMEQGRPLSGYSVNSSGSLEDVVTAGIRWEPDGGALRVISSAEIGGNILRSFAAHKSSTLQL
ncbi:hypothetical protein Nepgr_012715 [Nepenthes gracilis]|uniref:Two-component response regulator n=1 Tax=Nepenthes gracilis TaxID=150966 RepID=A0AAD3XNE8_NEPGR|nr:hypothetical protein Nepgr_012715 [Nepenthes gracilis]